MISSKTLLAVIVLCETTCFAAEKLKIVTSIPDLAWLATEVGGDRVEAEPLLRGTENPHYVDAIPEFVRLVAEADIVCVVGLDLEVGYMPAVLSRSGNSKVQQGGNGYCEVGQSVDVLEKPTGPINRSMGDVHPQGNPHFYLSPHALAEGAKVVASTLQVIDRPNAGAYQANLAALVKRLTALSQEIKERLRPFYAAQQAADQPLIIEYHREFTYFLNHYGIKSYGSVEEKPGVLPSAGRLGRLGLTTKKAGVKIVLATDYNPEDVLKKFSEISGVKRAVVPSMVQPDGKFKTYASLQKHIANSLVSLTAGEKTKN